MLDQWLDPTEGHHHIGPQHLGILLALVGCSVDQYEWWSRIMRYLLAVQEGQVKFLLVLIKNALVIN